MLAVVVAEAAAAAAAHRIRVRALLQHATATRLCLAGHPAPRPSSQNTTLRACSGGAGLPNMSFVLRKPEPLGTEMKCVCDGDTGVMLYLEIQKGKEPMRAAPFAKELGVCGACGVRLGAGSARRVHTAEAASEGAGSGGRWIPCDGQTCFGDSYFASAAAANAHACGIGGPRQQFGGPVKIAHRNFPKAFIEEKMKDWPGGTTLVLKAQYKDQAGAQHELIAVGTKYNARKCVCFVFTSGFSTRKGRAYMSKFRDSLGNYCQREVPRPECVARYYAVSPKVDNHNQRRQFLLALEKAWLPKGEGACWRRLYSTVLGICVVDAHLLCEHFLPVGHRLKGLTTKQFANQVAGALVGNTEDDTRAGSGRAPARAAGGGGGAAKRTNTGTPLNTVGERVYSLKTFETPRQSKLARSLGLKPPRAPQKPCVVCARLRKISQKTTFYCPELDDKPVCDPKLRGCLAWINAKQGVPEKNYLMTFAETEELAELDGDAPRGKAKQGNKGD